MEKEKRKTENRLKGIVNSFVKTSKSFSQSIPFLLGIILLIGLFQTFISKEMICSVFTGRMLHDTFIGTVTGSISTGSAITSYIIGGELLKGGVSLFAVTAFILAWVSVGVVQYPAEAGILGKKFAFFRNFISFIMAIFISIAMVTIMRLIL